MSGSQTADARKRSMTKKRSSEILGVKMEKSSFEEIWSVKIFAVPPTLRQVSTHEASIKHWQPTIIIYCKYCTTLSPRLDLLLTWHPKRKRRLAIADLIWCSASIKLTGLLDVAFVGAEKVSKNYITLQHITSFSSEPRSAHNVGSANCYLLTWRYGWTITASTPEGNQILSTCVVPQAPHKTKTHRDPETKCLPLQIDRMRQIDINRKIQRQS